MLILRRAGLVERTVFFTTGAPDRTGSALKPLSVVGLNAEAGFLSAACQLCLCWLSGDVLRWLLTVASLVLSLSGGSLLTAASGALLHVCQHAWWMRETVDTWISWCLSISSFPSQTWVSCRNDVTRPYPAYLLIYSWWRRVAHMQVFLLDYGFWIWICLFVQFNYPTTRLSR